MAEFNSHQDYWRFSQSVICRNRHVFEPQVDEFLNVVASTTSERIFTIDSGSSLYRAQLGFNWDSRPVDPVDPDGEKFDIEAPFVPTRMKPLPDSAREGRVNVKGIPCLYLSDDRDTAMAETRPWIGSFVSLGIFIVEKELRLVNCCVERHRFHIVPEPTHTPQGREKIAWGEISYALSEPVTPSDVTAEYAPTQVLSELFRRNGFDGIRYKSHLGSGHNYALFELGAANLQSCQLCVLKNISFSFGTTGNSYATTIQGNLRSSASNCG
jgi:hypothetical protein